MGQLPHGICPTVKLDPRVLPGRALHHSIYGALPRLDSPYYLDVSIATPLFAILSTASAGNMAPSIPARSWPNAQSFTAGVTNVRK